MNFNDYLKEKKNNISKNAKKAVATGLTVATILTGSSALTSCDRDNIEDLPDVNYSDLMSMIDEDINSFNEGFEYAGFMIGRNDNQYVLIFLDEMATDNASYNITKKQFDTIKKSVRGLSIEDGVDNINENSIVISNEILRLDTMDDIRKILADVVQKQDPYRIEQNTYSYQTEQYPNEFNCKSVIEEYIAELAKDHSEYNNFNIDEIIITKDQEKNTRVTIEIRDYYDNNNDGIDDRYRSFEILDDKFGEKLIMFLDIAVDDDEYEDIQFNDEKYVINSNIFNNYDYDKHVLFDTLLSNSLVRINMDSLIDAPIENTPEMAD